MTAKKTVLILILSTISLLLFVALSYLSYLGIKYYFQNKQQDKKIVVTEDRLGPPQEATPVGLVRNTQKLLQKAYSTRDVNGMMVQVNQVSTCQEGVLELYSTVTDQEGKTIQDIRPASDFSLTMDGQKISNFKFTIVEKEKLPLSIMLVIDHSGSMDGEPLNLAKEAAKSFLDSLKDTDLVGLIQFDSEVSTLQNLTTDKQQVKTMIDSIQAGTNTALYDVIYQASDETNVCGRKAIILLTDGRDTSSRKYKLEQALGKTNIDNIPIFAIGLRSSQYTPEVLKSLAEASGGQYFEAPTPKDLSLIYQKIADQIKGQYLFSFSNSLEKKGVEHRVKLESHIVGMPSSISSSEKSFVY